MNIDKITALIEKYFSGTLSPEEERQLHDWYRDKNLADPIDPALGKEEKNLLKKKILDTLLQQIQEEKTFPVIRLLNKHIPIRKIAAASIIFLLVAGGVFFYLSKVHPNKQLANIVAQHVLKNDIPPGHNGAVLHLSNGQSIHLDSLQNGKIAQQGGIQIIKDKGKLIYVGKTDEVIYNDITTARGQQWQLKLPDGTQVWLNAGSSIHYPLTFNGKERLVTITGEAYFDVVHNGKQPFRVKAGNTLIEDIGTAFNVNAYSDEPSIKTTLIHGSVKVSAGSKSDMLVPGQQAIIRSNNSIRVQKVDIGEAVAWKNGEIVFDNEDFQTIMRQVARWYNINVIYQGRIPKITFAGSISRQLNLSEFLKVLQFENIHYSLEGKNITIIK